MKKIFLVLFLIPVFVFCENISVLGIGRLGLCMALCFEKAGYNVLGVDLSEKYISLLNEKSFESPEPSVTEYLKQSKNFLASTSLKEALDFSDTYFIVVPTNKLNGENPYDTKILSDLLEVISSYNISNKHIIISGTVPPGYITKTAKKITQNCASITYSYNPEFIAQGDIIRGLENPDIVLIGEEDVNAGKNIENIYRKVCQNSPYYAHMSIESAEITKMALNCFVTAKIAFANLVSEIADETEGADKEMILATLGKDQRIGSKCIKPGYGFGGPCFPRDNRALAMYATSIGINPCIFNTTDIANEQHANYMAQKFLDQNLPEYVFEEVNYKPNCPVAIIEKSQKLLVAKKIAERGKKVIILDSENIIKEVEREYGDLFTYSSK